MGTREELLEAERGTVRKDWGGKIRIALAYPNYYHVGMSNLGFHAIYRLLNNFEDVVCERVFLPEDKGTVQGGLRSMESQRPLADFDIIAFSISFENDYPNLLTLLAASRIPRWSSERNPPHPLIIAGGVTTFLNPEPIAPFVDCFLIGEAESILAVFLDVYKRYSDKQALLEALAAHVPGIYVPALYDVAYHLDGTIAEFRPKRGAPEKVQRVGVEALSYGDTCTAILTPHTTFQDTYLVEVARGCPYGCRFCAAGFVYRPPRFRPKTVLQNCIEEGAARSKRIGLMAAAVLDVPDIEALCREALDRGVQLSFSSLRADRLTPEILDILKQSGFKTAAIAPDAGSERMRRVINKGITDQDVIRAAGLLVDAGIPNLKLYCMVGLPTETMSDVEAIVVLCKQVKHRFLKASRTTERIGQIIVSLNSFIPKPFTPFQWVPLEDVKSLKAKIKHVRDSLRRVANVRVHADVPRWAYIQALLSRGDRRTAQLLAAAHENNGNWAKTLKASIINPDFYVYRERPLDEILPWDFIDHGINKAFLVEEYHKALRAESSPPCVVGQCKACGVCK
ncbi:MAG: radical SAM protein [Deltaproteobacteria bacterium]|nr:radical SAM protein [Deltaproteobacteria bacterium]MBW2018538.1 radical SAM protein [Deltaproteobacteria bacterium]MBW2073273.1 radical SAM protein [Deltaproteobacteria bacterium]RLB83359.1 MAG: radical SAM protein [Deltaproteobacteria bacterium]